MFKFKVNSPVNVDQLEIELTNYPNEEFKSYLVNGLKQGFDTGFKVLPTSSVECKNLRSTFFHKEHVADLIDVELRKGYLYGPFDSIPFSEYRINPIGVVESKYSNKKRLIVDLSAPHENPEHPSLNELICKEEYSLQYVTIDDAISIIKKLGKKSWLIKTDITDAFKIIPILPKLWPYHGIQWNGKYYFF